MPHSRGAGPGWPSHKWDVYSARIFSLSCIVKRFCWKSNMLALISARNILKCPQTCKRCSSKHLQKKCCVHPVHLNGIPILKVTAFPSVMIHTYRLITNNVNQWDCWPCQSICEGVWWSERLLMEPTFICYVWSNINSWSWNERHVNWTCSLASDIRPGRTVCNSMLWTVAACKRWWHLLAKHYYGGWLMCLWLWPWDKTNVVRTEDPIFTLLGSRLSAVRNQDNHDHRLWLGGFVASRISFPRMEY